jgi:hypothetical protein
MTPTLTLVWLWFWFIFGSTIYMVKRGFYLIKGPNPVANNLKQFISVAWLPLLFRFVVDSMIYWAFFTPEIVQAGLSYLGMQKFAGIIAVITHFAVCSLGFGLIVDSMVDWGIGTVISRIPFLKDWWAQMPAPLPKALVVDPPNEADRQLVKP